MLHLGDLVRSNSPYDCRQRSYADSRQNGGFVGGRGQHEVLKVVEVQEA